MLIPPTPSSDTPAQPANPPTSSPAAPWLGVLTLGGLVAWCGLHATRSSAQVALLAALRSYRLLPATGDTTADWATFQALTAAEDDGRLAPLHYYLGQVPIAPVPVGK